MELPIGQCPFVTPSPSAIEDASNLLCNVVRLFNIARLAEVGVALHQVVDIRLPALGRCLVAPQPVEGCAPMTFYLILLGGPCR